MLALAFAFFPAWSIAGTPLNSCADPYWAGTLRCITHPAAVPQPVAPAPTQPSQLREFTRVMLNADLGIRCLDGTRPIIYVDPALGGSSSKWLISLTGGGSCNAEDRDQNGSFENGNECAVIYADPSEADEMGTSNKPIMKTLGTTGNTSAGILKPDLVLNPVFARYHRVRVEKCSYDRHNGRATHAVTATPPGRGLTINYTLFQHGQKILNLALDALRGNGTGQSGLSYQTYVADGMGGVMPEAVTLPSLADASTVLFVGHSGGAHGLYHNIDRLAAKLRAMPGFAGDVRVIHDANFLPGPENEASFDASNPAGLFAQRFSGTSSYLGFYDAGAYYNTPSADNRAYYEQYRSWFEAPTDGLETIFDASCVAAHTASADTWKCRDRIHVRIHHEATPALVREDFTDPNSEHTRNGAGHLIPWGPYAAYSHCSLVSITPCPPLALSGPGSEHDLRLRTQAQGFISGYPLLSELSTGADTSGPAPSSYLWMPDCSTHEGTYDDTAYYESRLIAGTSMMSLSRLAEAFVAAPRTGVQVAWVDGIGGADSECGPRLLTDSFE